jgi:hypothetical protein
MFYQKVRFDAIAVAFAILTVSVAIEPNRLSAQREKAQATSAEIQSDIVKSLADSGLSSLQAEAVMEAAVRLDLEEQIESALRNPPGGTKPPPTDRFSKMSQALSEAERRLPKTELLEIHDFLAVAYFNHVFSAPNKDHVWALNALLKHRRDIQVGLFVTELEAYTAKHGLHWTDEFRLDYTEKLQQASDQQWEHLVHQFPFDLAKITTTDTVAILTIDQDSSTAFRAISLGWDQPVVAEPIQAPGAIGLALEQPRTGPRSEQDAIKLIDRAARVMARDIFDTALLSIHASGVWSERFSGMTNTDWPGLMRFHRR